MQQPLDLAKMLAQSLANSSEYQQYRAAKTKMESDEAAKNMFEDFRKKQLELERKKVSGVKLTDAEEKELRKLMELVSLNLYVREYLMAEYTFSKLMMDIQKTIGEAVELQMPEEFMR